MNKCTLITTSAGRSINGAACGEVTVLVSKRADQALAEVWTVNKRIRMGFLCDYPIITVTINYAPTEKKEETDERFKTISNKWKKANISW